MPELPSSWSPADIHTWAVIAQFAFAGITVVLLLVVSAPYGRHTREGWGVMVPNRLGWIVMESPAVLLFTWLFFRGPSAWNTVPLLFWGLWQLHYVHRTFIFPFRTRTSGKSMPISIVLLALLFNTLNAYVNATWIGSLGSYPTSWLSEATTIIGIAVFLIGWAINIWADTVLINLRKAPGEGYKIPHGGLYEHISCPNYFGEIIEWIGWAIATWSWAGLAFAVYVIANLAPRAFTNHAWYRETFDDYPPERKALVPFIA